MVTNGELRNKRFEELTKEIVNLHLKKCKDYGTIEDPLANLREFGLLGVIIRINDKVVRIKSFARNGQLYVKEESVVDTLKDLATYSLLGIQLYEEEKKNKNGIVPSEGLGPTSTSKITVDFTSPTTTATGGFNVSSSQNSHLPPCSCPLCTVKLVEPKKVDKKLVDNYPSLSEKKRRFRLPEF